MELSYRQHQQLVTVVRQLADLLDRQSQRLSRVTRHRGVHGELPGDSVLHNTWSHLGTAFQLLTAHARSVQNECDRLGIEHGLEDLR